MRPPAPRFVEQGLRAAIGVVYRRGDRGRSVDDQRLFPGTDSDDFDREHGVVKHAMVSQRNS
jgi:hypothetical protein